MTMTKYILVLKLTRGSEWYVRHDLYDSAEEAIATLPDMKKLKYKVVEVNFEEDEF